MRKFLILFIAVLSSCSHSKHDILSNLEEIKLLGNSNPQEALEKLDTLSLSMVYESTYMRMKYELLQIRLQDKAYIIPQSDKQVKRILPFFLENGTSEEKQEMLYYAGSVYRDLKDSPRAIDFFLRSKDVAETAGRDCDSLLLRNTYSNLCYLFGQEHDNKSTLEYAIKEYEISSAISDTTINSLMHMGDAYFACDSTTMALPFYDRAMNDLEKKSPLDRNRVARLLYIYSHLQESDKADKCAMLLDSSGHYSQMKSKQLFSLGEYYRIIGRYDEAIVCNQCILGNDDDDLTLKYDASRYLFLLFREKGDDKKALYYGEQFIDISGQLNLGKRQELAATVNNIYKYYKDKEDEQKLIIDIQAFHERTQRMALLFIVLIAIVIAGIVTYRNLQLKKILNLKGKILEIKKEKTSITRELSTKQAELLFTKEELNRTTSELQETRTSLEETAIEAQKLAVDLKNQECILKEKIEQNKTIISLMHQTIFEGSAEEIIIKLKKSSEGRGLLQEKEWNSLYYAIDKLWPTFKEQMCLTLGRVSDQQRKVCYLIKSGFTPGQIRNMTGLSRTTVWRWVNKFDWIDSVL